MSRKKSMRKQLYVDSKVQGALVARVALYWIGCLAALTIMLLCWRMITGPARPFDTHFDDLWYFYGPAMIASFLLLPVVIVDILRVSNRFAGPMLRMRRSMRRLAEGGHVDRLDFRTNDFWREFADDFNRLADRLEAAQRTSAQSDTAAVEEPSRQEEEPVGVGHE